MPLRAVHTIRILGSDVRFLSKRAAIAPHALTCDADASGSCQSCSVIISEASNSPCKPLVSFTLKALMVGSTLYISCSDAALYILGCGVHNTALRHDLVQAKWSDAAKRKPTTVDQRHIYKTFSKIQMKSNRATSQTSEREILQKSVVRQP